MEKDIIFKKAAIGGFDKEDVMNYIAKITDEFQAYKQQAQKTITELKANVAELEKANSELLEKYDAVCEKLNEHNEETTEKADAAPTEDIRTMIEGLYDNIKSLIQSHSEEETAPSDEDDSKKAEASETATDIDELTKIIDKYTD